MKRDRLGFSEKTIDQLIHEDREERQLALEYVAEAWNTAEADGVEPLALAHASLFAALAALVERHGDGPTADFIATLPDRIRSGEYNIARSLQ